jgi:N-methylhydantoinase B
VNGGLPGSRSRKLLQRADGSEQLLQSKCDRIKVEIGDLLVYETWGGGGCGDPLERDPAQVAFDVAAGLVSPEGARRYGVVLKAARVDAKATAALRAGMAKSRGAVPLFDRGFKDIAELKGRCLAETGLEPPAAPQFQSRARMRKVAVGRRA